MGKELSELASYMLPPVEQLLAECGALCEAEGTTCEVIDTGRTTSEQEVKLAQGVSWTQHSKHLPQPPENKSEAIDIAPASYMRIKNWNPGGPLWAKFGEIGERLGLKWGGRFPTPDPGHFQWLPRDITVVVPEPQAPQITTDPELSTT